MKEETIQRTAVSMLVTLTTLLAIIIGLILYVVFTDTACADTYIVEPPVYDDPNSDITIQEVYSNDTGDFVGSQYTYDYSDGNTVTEIVIEED